LKLLRYICHMKKYRTVITYKDYFEEFVRKQRPKVIRKIFQTLRIIEQIERIPASYLKYIENTDGLFEIRIAFSSEIFRIFCFFDAGKLIVLLSGFQKKTQKTPPEEIKRAIRLMNSYYQDKEKENEQ
jgi:phage-related protein